MGNLLNIFPVIMQCCHLLASCVLVTAPPKLTPPSTTHPPRHQSNSNPNSNLSPPYNPRFDFMLLPKSIGYEPMRVTPTLLACKIKCVQEAANSRSISLYPRGSLPRFNFNFEGLTPGLHRGSVVWWLLEIQVRECVWARRGCW